MKNITLHGVDRRHFWSNGMFVRASRGLGPKLIDSFKTDKGVADQSTPGNLETVCLPGSYQFEGLQLEKGFPYSYLVSGQAGRGRAGPGGAGRGRAGQGDRAAERCRAGPGGQAGPGGPIGQGLAG